MLSWKLKIIFVFDLIGIERKIKGRENKRLRDERRTEKNRRNIISMLSGTLDFIIQPLKIKRRRKNNQVFIYRSSPEIEEKWTSTSTVCLCVFVVGWWRHRSLASDLTRRGQFHQQHTKQYLFNWSFFKH